MTEADLFTCNRLLKEIDRILERGGLYAARSRLAMVADAIPGGRLDDGGGINPDMGGIDQP